jgi:hypothetical protein
MESNQALRAIQRLHADFERGGDARPSAGFLEREEKRYRKEHQRSTEEARDLAERERQFHEQSETVLAGGEVLERLHALRAGILEQDFTRDLDAVRALLLRVFQGATFVELFNGELADGECALAVDAVGDDADFRLDVSAAGVALPVGRDPPRIKNPGDSMWFMLVHPHGDLLDDIAGAATLNDPRGILPLLTVGAMSQKFPLQLTSSGNVAEACGSD